MSFRRGDYVTAKREYVLKECDHNSVGLIVDTKDGEEGMTVYIQWTRGTLGAWRTYQLEAWNGVVAMVRLLD